MRTLQIFAGIVALCAVAGCGTGTSATGEWREPRSANAPYDHVLVVGVSPNSRVRRSFAKSGADAVVVTRLLGRSVSSGITQERVDVKAGRTVTVIEQPGMTEVYAANYSLTREPGELVAKSKAIIEATLYDVADSGRAVYVVTVNTRFEETDGDVLVDVTGNLADAIAAELRSNRLVE
jgi:hypothetical protein